MISSQTRAHMRAMNKFLKGLYGKPRDIIEMSGLEEEQREKLYECCLDDYLRQIAAFVEQAEGEGKDWERRRAAMLRYYGIKTGKGETLQSIGDEYGVTRERVRQLREKCLQALRDDAWHKTLEHKVQQIAQEVLTEH